MIQRYTEIDQPHAVSEWGMTEDDNGEWVKYDDIKHLLDRNTDSEDVKCEKDCYYFETGIWQPPCDRCLRNSWLEDKYNTDNEHDLKDVKLVKANLKISDVLTEAEDE